MKTGTLGDALGDTLRAVGVPCVIWRIDRRPSPLRNTKTDESSESCDGSVGGVWEIGGIVWGRQIESAILHPLALGHPPLRAEDLLTPCAACHQVVGYDIAGACRVLGCGYVGWRSGCSRGDSEC